jgi:hypothetical protein
MKGDLKIMARFFKLNKSKPEQIPSIRKSKMKLAAALIASMMALPALGLTAHGYTEIDAGVMNVPCNKTDWDGRPSVLTCTTCAWDNHERYPFTYALSQDGRNIVERRLTPLRNPYLDQHGRLLFLIPNGRRRTIVLTTHKVQLGVALNSIHNAVVVPWKGTPVQDQCLLL